MTLTPGQWVFAVVAALLVGVSKTGIAGMGMLFVVIFAQIFPAKQATGLVLPLLCFGDLVAVASYRQHANWRHLWRLFPWTALGVVIGFFAVGQIADHEMRRLIGGIVVTLVVVHLVRRLRAGNAETEHGAWFAPTIGVLAGFTTLVANAAGPLMAVYLLAMRLPKMEYVGTAAVFFLLLNLFKVPFMVGLGFITPPSFAINLWLAPAVLAGAWLGRRILPKINQKVFENLALFFLGGGGIAAFVLIMARMNVRQMWAAKLAGKEVPATTHSRVNTAEVGLNFGRKPPFAGVVLGIDPSLRGTGLALVEFATGRSPLLLRCQTVKVHPKLSMPQALAEIHRAVTAILAGVGVRHVAMEQTIFVQNFQTAQILGAARGAAMTAAALQELPVFEYAPLRVKQAVVGAGRASKEQMARTVMAMMGHGRPLAFDEADAAGVALCHAFTWRES